MKQPYERNRGPHTINTGTATSEHTVIWLDPVEASSVPENYRARGRGRVPAPAPPGAADLWTLVAELEQLGFQAPDHIVWKRMPNKWGHCYSASRTVEISTTAIDLPLWVLKAIVAHELAHLEVEGHGPGFKIIVNRYDLAREADGYLAAIQASDWGIDVEPHLHHPRRSST